MTIYGVVLAIMDMASAKSDVKGPKIKVCFGDLNWKVRKKGEKKIFQKTYRPSLYWTSQGFPYIF